QTAHGGEQRVRGNHAVALRAYERDTRIDEFLLRVEYVEGGALTHASLLAHAVKGDFGSLHLRLRGLNIGLGGIQLTPGLHDGLAHLVARCVEIDAAL